MNVLFLTHRLPYAPNRGDRIRAYHLLRTLASRHTVSLVSLAHDADEASHRDDVASMCAACEVALVPRRANLLRGALSLPGTRPLTQTLLASPDWDAAVRRAMARHAPDVVLAYCSGMAQHLFEDPLRRLPFVLDMVDVDSAKWRDQAAASTPPMRWIYAREQRTLAAFEVRSTRAAAFTLVTNERERETLASQVPGADIRIVPNGIDVGWFAPPVPPADAATVVFTGVMNYAPNVDAVNWFAREIWPLVVSRRPDARLEIVGANPTSEVMALASSTILVTGSVPDTRPHLWKAAVAVAPLRRARGVQNKVLEAVAAGLPVVATPVVREGLPTQVLDAVRSASTAPAFAEAVVELLGQSPDSRRSLAAGVDLNSLSWPTSLAPVTELLVDAAKTLRR